MGLSSDKGRHMGVGNVAGGPLIRQKSHMAVLVGLPRDKRPDTSGLLDVTPSCRTCRCRWSRHRRKDPIRIPTTTRSTPRSRTSSVTRAKPRRVAGRSIGSIGGPGARRTPALGLSPDRPVGVDAAILRTGVRRPLTTPSGRPVTSTSAGSAPTGRRRRQSSHRHGPAPTAGSPSSTAVRAGPWDSPAVSQRNMVTILPCDLAVS